MPRGVTLKTKMENKTTLKIITSILGIVGFVLIVSTIFFFISESFLFIPSMICGAVCVVYSLELDQKSIEQK